MYIKQHAFHHVLYVISSLLLYFNKQGYKLCRILAAEATFGVFSLLNCLS